MAGHGLARSCFIRTLRADSALCIFQAHDKRIPFLHKPTCSAKAPVSQRLGGSPRWELALRGDSALPGSGLADVSHCGPLPQAAQCMSLPLQAAGPPRLPTVPQSAGTGPVGLSVITSVSCV